MNIVFAVAAALTSSIAFAEPAMTEAQITRSPSFDLYLESAPTVTLNLTREVADYDFGVIPQGTEYLARVEAEITFNVLPSGCNTFFLNGEIITQLSTSGRVWDQKDFTTQVQLGTLWPLGVGSTCIGVPSRPARLKLEIVNGIGRFFGEERLLSYEFTGPDNQITGNAEKFRVTIAVRQSQLQAEVHSIDRITDEPTILTEYTQVISCENDRTAGESLTITVTKRAGEDKAVIVGRNSEWFGSADETTLKLTRNADEQGFGVVYSAPSEAGGIKTLDIQERGLGWASPRIQVNFQERAARRFGFLDCRTISIQ